MMKNIPREALVYFHFSKKESDEKLSWKHDREFQYKGEMYDIVYKEIINDSVSYWCWRDTEETVLYQKMKEIVLRAPDHLPGKKDSERKWKEFQKNLFCTNAEFLPAFVTNSYATDILTDDFIYRSKFLDSDSPPPEYYFS